MAFEGFYINLDRSTGRRAEIERELARVGLAGRYRRFRAVDGKEVGAAPRYALPNPNAVGCFLSHAGVLDAVADADAHRHIVEDDVVFATRTESILSQLIGQGAMEAFDILYTDIGLPLSVEGVRPFKALYDRAVTLNPDGSIARAAFQVIDLRGVAFVSTSSYLVNRRSVTLLRDLYAAEIRAGLRAPIDDFFRLQAEVGALKVGCVFPFVTSVRVEHALDSTVRRQPDVTRRFVAADLARYSFFIERDQGEMQRLADAYIPQIPATDGHAQLLARLLTFGLAAAAT